MVASEWCADRACLGLSVSPQATAATALACPIPPSRRGLTDLPLHRGSQAQRERLEMIGHAEDGQVRRGVVYLRWAKKKDEEMDRLWRRVEQR